MHNYTIKIIWIQKLILFIYIIYILALLTIEGDYFMQWALIISKSISTFL